MQLKTVLVEYTTSKGDLLSTSATSISDKLVLLSANIFSLNLAKTNKLTNGLHHASALFPNPEKYKLRIISGRDRHFKSTPSKLLACIFCSDIKQSIRNILSDWKINGDAQAGDLDVLSVFVILGADGADYADVKPALMELRGCCASDWGVTDKVCITSVPFGNRSFQDYYSEGCVSNLVGVNGCFVLTDCPTVFGCEGSLIRLKKDKKPIGIVISSVNWSRGEWIGLTLGATLLPLLDSICNVHSSNYTHLNNKIYDQINQSLVQVVNGNSWGTAILLDKKLGIFITNSHVVENAWQVNLHWREQLFKASVIFKTPIDTNDVAILKCKDLAELNGSDMMPMEVHEGMVLSGTPIMAAGFPIFSARLGVRPTISRGHISLVSETLVFTTAVVLAGASGGALISPEHKLIGLICANMKSNQSGAIHPRVNMAIPTSWLWPSIQEYLKTNNLDAFRKVALVKSPTYSKL